MSWLGNRAGERFTYRRVRWTPNDPATHFSEAEEYGNITRGTIELAAFTDAKASCSFDFEGGTAPDTVDLVRVYYSFTDDGGDSENLCLGTFFVNYGDVSYTESGGSLVPSGTVEGESVLSVLLDKKLGAPYTVAAGTDCVAEAQSIIENLGLPTNQPESPAIETQSAYTFEPDDAVITVVNWLLGQAGYRACWPNAYGAVQLAPYQDASQSEPVATFRDDENSIMLPEVSVENDWASIPNVARLSFANDEEALYAVASLDSGNRASLAARGGRELTLQEEISDLQGATQADRIAELEALAVQRLTDNSREIERVTLQHALIPGIEPNASIAVDYSGTVWTGSVTNVSISLETSAPCTTKTRRFIAPQSLTITTEGGVSWQA